MLTRRPLVWCQQRSGLTHGCSGDIFAGMVTAGSSVCWPTVRDARRCVADGATTRGSTGLPNSQWTRRGVEAETRNTSHGSPRSSRGGCTSWPVADTVSHGSAGTHRRWPRRLASPCEHNRHGCRGCLWQNTRMAVTGCMILGSSYGTGYSLGRTGPETRLDCSSTQTQQVESHTGQDVSTLATTGRGSRL